jgi:aminopeptidase N
MMKNLYKVVGVFAILFRVAAFSYASTADQPKTAGFQADKNDYDVLFYHLDLNVSDTSTFISGSTTIAVKSLLPSLQQVIFDFSDLLTTDSVLIENQKVVFTHGSNLLTIDLNNALASGKKAYIKIFYHGLGSTVEVPDGIYNKYVTSMNKHVTWTLSEPFSSFYWFPCKQLLTDKADSVYVFLSTDAKLKAGSNGLLTAQVPLPDNRIRYEWKSRYPIAFYLISFTVTDYLDYSFYVTPDNASDSILVQNYVYNDSAYFRQIKANILKTGDLIKLYSDLFGQYPFADEKYGHCMAPFGGGMEHQTMTTLVNFSFLLVAHELSHQWFGDYVTCSSWQDIWVNEGFASYAEYLANQYLVSQEEADKWIDGSNTLVKSQPDGSVYVPETSIDDDQRIFDYRLTYRKGASIIHMLRQEVGNDALFFSILSSYLDKFKNSTASGNDFKNHVEERTGKNFSQFFSQWYYGSGYPVHSIQWEQRNDTLYINSEQSVTSTTPFFNLLLEFRITFNNRDTIIAFRQTANSSKWKVYFPHTIAAVKADPNHWLLIDLSDFSSLAPASIDTTVRIVPNPANDKIQVQLEKYIGRYKLLLTNSDGKVLTSRDSSALTQEIDVHAYPPGIYFIIIKNEKTTRNGKFIIN